MKTIFQAFRIFIVLTVLTGILYPLSITFAAKIFFPAQSNGSLITINGKLIGSELLAQKFQSDRYFWPRPSGADFATVASGASNQGPTNAALKATVEKRAEEFKKAHGVQNVPSEMIFASASGLDPHISPAAARIQIARVAKARNMDEKVLARLVESHTEQPQYHVFGEPRVNVLRLNIALDSL